MMSNFIFDLPFPPLPSLYMESIYILQSLVINGHFWGTILENECLDLSNIRHWINRRFATVALRLMSFLPHSANKS